MQLSVHQRVAMQQLSAKVFKLSFEYLHIYSPKSGIFCWKNSKIASLMSCQRPYLRKTLKYSQSWDLDGIQWIRWIYTELQTPPLPGFWVLYTSAQDRIQRKMPVQSHSRWRVLRSVERR